MCHLETKWKNVLLNGVEKIEINFNYIKNKVNEDNLSQRNQNRNPKSETLDQLENVFVFNLELYSDQEFAEAYAVSFCDVNRLRDGSDRDSIQKRNRD